MGAGKNEPLAEDLLYPGMRIEVLSAEKQFIFRGTIRRFDVDAVYVENTSGDEIPPVLYNTTVHLRGFARGLRSIVLIGKISGSTDRFWRIGELSQIHFQEGRKYFRQTVSVPARIMNITEVFEPGSSRGGDAAEGELLPCTLLDVSGGGIRFASRHKFAVGDYIYLFGVQFFPDEPPFSMICRILRTEDAGRQSQFGCCFEAMEVREHDRLIRVILKLQRLALTDKTISGPPDSAGRT